MQPLDAWICFNSFFSSLFNLSKCFFFTFIVSFVRPKHNKSIIMISDIIKLQPYRSLTIYPIETPLDSFENRADPGQGQLCLVLKYDIYDPA